MARTISFEAVGNGLIPLGTTREIPSAVLENMVGPNDLRTTLADYAYTLRERTDAVCRFSGGLPAFEKGLQVFPRYCDDVGLWVDPPVNLSKEPYARGDEHEDWFVGNRLIKLAHPGFFGLRVVDEFLADHAPPENLGLDDVELVVVFLADFVPVVGIGKDFVGDGDAIDGNFKMFWKMVRIGAAGFCGV